MGRFCLVVELPQGESGTKGATVSSSKRFNINNYTLVFIFIRSLTVTTRFFKARLVYTAFKHDRQEVIILFFLVG